MCSRVKDDALSKRIVNPQPGRKSHRNRLCDLALVAYLLVLWPNTAFAQNSLLEATVHEIQETRKWIHVPVNQSVMIETNLPIARQQSLSDAIAKIESISPTQALVKGVAVGRTQVIIWADDQQMTFDVSVEQELSQLEEAIRRVAPHADIRAHPILDTVVISGTVSDAHLADRIMQVAAIFSPTVQNHLQIAGEQQVLLRVTMAEVSRSVLRQFGVNGLMLGQNFRDFQVLSNIGAINPTSFGFGGGNISNNIPFVTGGTAVGANPTLSMAFPRVQMQLFVQALRENGLLKVLAEPNLVAISGRTASFLAGGEFPIPVPQTTGGAGNTITIQFREFGVRLAFTPIVLANQNIRLNIAPEVSELDFARGVSIGGFTVPGLNVRRTETTVEIGNGQSFVISGLLSENVRATSTRLPGLGELPILGALFASREFRKNLTELVVMVTPEIVSPLNPDQIGVMPGFDVEDPDDWQLFALGLLERPLPEEAAESSAHSEAWPAAGGSAGAEGRSKNALLGPWGQSDLDENQ